ncbi:50S ribosomal protein L9, partial [bacterium]|nr:50S ribosomal protein L9 [bacterium]
LEAKRDHKRKEAAETLAADLVKKDLSVTIGAKAGEEDRLYGSVTARDIATALGEQRDLEIDHHQIVLDAPLKETGEFEVPVKLHAEVSITVKVNVEAAE